MQTPGKQMQELDWFSSPDFQAAFVTVTGKGDTGMGPLVHSGTSGSFWCGCFKGHCQLGMQSLPHDTHIFVSFLLAKYAAVVALLCGREAVALKQEPCFFLWLLYSFSFPTTWELLWLPFDSCCSLMRRAGAW